MRPCPKRPEMRCLEVCADQPVVKQADRSRFQRLWAADEPVAVRAFHPHIVEVRQAAVSGPPVMIVMHDGDAQPLGRSFQDQLARIVMIDRGRLELLKAQRLFPRGVAFRQFAVNQESLFGQSRRIGVRPKLLGQLARSDRMDRIVVQLHGMERIIRLLGQDDRAVQRIAHALVDMRASVDIDMQARV